MLLEDIIQRVQSLYSKGVQSKDSRLTSQHIYSVLITSRSTLLRQQSSKGQFISDWNYQALPCVELVQAPIHECPKLDTGCIMLKSKYPLPSPINNLDKHLIGYVTTMDGSQRFDSMNFENLKYAKGAKYVGNKAGYFITAQGHLGITVYKNLKAVKVDILADDPVKAKIFPNFCADAGECECDDIMKWEFPLDNSLVGTAIQMASNELIVMFKQMGEDRKANASDDGSMTGSMVHQPQEGGGNG